MSVDTISNFLTTVRNGILASKSAVTVPYSRMTQDIVAILRNEGFIRDFSVTEDGGKKNITIVLKYVDGESVIHALVRVSKPSCRLYEKSQNLPHIVGKLGISVITTNRGIMTNKQARELGIGGEVICSIW